MTLNGPSTAPTPENAGKGEKHKRKQWRGCLVLLAGGSLFILLGVVLVLRPAVNWAGSRAWEEAKARIEAEGETVDFRKTFPAPVADADNFCAVGPLRAIAEKDDPEGYRNRQRLEAVALPPTPQQGSKEKGKPREVQGPLFGTATDLAAWADWLRSMKESSKSMSDTGDAVRDLMTYLAKNEALYQELTAVLDRPEALWTPLWQQRIIPAYGYGLSMPHYKGIQELTRLLSLRGLTAAAVGDVAKAHTFNLVQLRFAEASARDPDLLGPLTSRTMAVYATHGVWNACRLHLGTAEDFQRLERGLTRLNYEQSYLQALRYELGIHIQALQWLKTRGPQPSASDGQYDWLDQLLREEAAPYFFYRVFKTGFLDFNIATTTNFMLDYGILPLRDRGLREAAEMGDELNERLLRMQEKFDLRGVTVVYTLPTIVRIAEAFLLAQCQVNQAIIACALERHRIAHGVYPATLEGLTLADGKPLPLDISAVPAAPMKYRVLTGEGGSSERYELWCVGWDAEDDGGKRLLDVKEPERTRFGMREYEGDWVWGW